MITDNGFSIPLYTTVTALLLVITKAGDTPRFKCQNNLLTNPKVTKNISLTQVNWRLERERAMGRLLGLISATGLRWLCSSTHQEPPERREKQGGAEDLAPSNTKTAGCHTTTIRLLFKVWMELTLNRHNALLHYTLVSFPPCNDEISIGNAAGAFFFSSF